jgi:pyruvate formate lyase activating enzyme
MSNRGIIFDIKRFAIHDGPGIRTTVFFQGCPLDCPWCHNPEGKRRLAPGEEVEGLPEGGYNGGLRSVTPASLVREVEKDRIFYDQSGGGITISGGEPLLQPDFLESFLLLCRERGFSVILDTSGYSEYNYIDRIAELVDTFYFDVKIAESSRHREVTGVSNDIILSNMEKLAGAGTDIVPRVALIPGFTDSVDNLEGIAGLLSGMVKIETVCILRYNRWCKDKIRRFGFRDRLGILPDEGRVSADDASSIFSERGFKVEIEG